MKRENGPLGVSDKTVQEDCLVLETFDIKVEDETEYLPPNFKDVQESTRKRKKLSTLDNLVTNAKSISTQKSKQFDEQLIKMIVKGYHPVSIVDDIEFRNFINMLCPGYKLPDKKTISTNLIPELYNNARENVKNNIENASAICITTDSWTSVNNQSFIAVTAHWIDGTEFKSNLLECVEFNDKHTADNLTNLLQKVFEEWGIISKVTCVVSDNTANISISIGSSCYLVCFAHMINLIVEKGLKEIDPSLNKVRKIIEHFRNNSHVVAKLNQIQEQMNLPILKLKTDVCTQWNSTLDMLRRFIGRKESIISTMTVLCINTWHLTPDEWEILKCVVDILKIFDDITQEVSTKKTVTISKIFLFITAMEKHLLRFHGKHLNGSLQKMINVLLNQIDKRLKSLEKNELLCEATLLDPRFKRLGFFSADKADVAFEFLKNKFLIMRCEQEVEESHEKSSLKEEDNPSSSLLWEDFDAKVERSKTHNDPMSGSIVELDKYVNEPLIGRNENPLLWWEQRKEIYPFLYSLAKKRLCITATSAPCQQIFSKSGQITTNRRSCLKGSKLNQIVFLNYNL